MKTIRCPGCDKDISTKEIKCPYCGKFIFGYYKMTPLMQKFFKVLMIIIGILAFLLIAINIASENKQEAKKDIEKEISQTNSEPLKAQIVEEKIDETPFKIALQNISQKIVGNKYGHVLIELDLRKDMYRVCFVYEKDPMSMSTAKALSLAGVKSVIDMLMEQKRDPNNEWISIFARVHTNVTKKSVTGKEQVRTYGVAEYDFLDDKIIWKQVE